MLRDVLLIAGLRAPGLLLSGTRVHSGHMCDRSIYRTGTQCSALTITHFQKWVTKLYFCYLDAPRVTKGLTTQAGKSVGF